MQMKDGCVECQREEKRIEKEEGANTYVRTQPAETRGRRRVEPELGDTNPQAFLSCLPRSSLEYAALVSQ